MRRGGVGIRGGRGWQDDGRRFRRGPGGEDFVPEGEFAPEGDFGPDLDFGADAALTPIYVPDDVGLDGGPESN